MEALHNLNTLEACQSLKQLSVDDDLKNLHTASLAAVFTVANTFTHLTSALQKQCHETAWLKGQLKRVDVLEKELSATQERCQQLEETIEENDKKQEENLRVAREELQEEIKETNEKTETKLRAEFEAMVREMAGNIESMEQELKKTSKIATANKQKVDVATKQVQECTRTVKAMREETTKKFKEMETTLKNKTDELTKSVESFQEEVREGMKAYEEKFQEFRFQTHQELARKADIEDLQKKLDVRIFKSWQEETNKLRQEQEDAVEEVKRGMAGVDLQISEVADKEERHFQEGASERASIGEQIQELHNAIAGQESPEAMCLQTREELNGQMIGLEESIQAQLEDKLSAVAQAFQPTFGDSNGRCYSCGQNNPMSPNNRSRANSSSFAQMPSRDIMSPKRSAGGGFRGVASPMNNRKSMHKNNSMGSLEGHHHQDVRKSTQRASKTALRHLQGDHGQEARPKSKGKVQVKTGPVKLPDIQ